MLNESMSLRKSNYNKVVYSLGTEKEFGDTIANYVITDALRVKLMLCTAFDFILKDKQQQTSYNLLKDSFECINKFNDIFRNYRVTKYYDKDEEIKEYLLEVSEYVNNFFCHYHFDDMSFSSDKNVITVKIFFSNSFGKSVFDIFKEIFNSKKFNTLNDLQKTFLFEFSDDSLSVYYNSKINLCYINDNVMEFYYKIVNV